MGRGDELLAIVPARGGSRGVPRKNMRSLAGRPLIAHTLGTVAEAAVAERLVLSSDDTEILRWAALHGYQAQPRPAELAGPESTISDLAAHIADELEWEGIVGVFQPTSPLLRADTIHRAVEHFLGSEASSLASVIREPHYFWLEEGEPSAVARPLFGERVNRQFARHPVLRETGGIQLVRAGELRASRLIVSHQHLPFEVEADEGLDIDTAEDLIAARMNLARGTVVFRVQASGKVGSGHLHHCLQLADELADHDLWFLLRDCDEFVSELLDRYGYRWREERELTSDLRELAGPGPNLVVNDVLDTEEQDILAERALGFKVVNVEDLGPGARFADWVVNALYPIGDDADEGSAWGPRYATLRSEFFDLPPKEIRQDPKRVLITFGGTDPAGLALRCANLLAGAIPQEVRVVTGPAGSREGFSDEVDLASEQVSMAEELMAADLAITSAGRTVYEAAATGTPVVVLAANAREATHAHVGYESGVVFLGIGSLAEDEYIVQTVERLLGDAELRRELSGRLRASIDGLGAARIAHRIRALLLGI
jgi:CMP-N-acetylneuraminic acid synthetase/spore coat polysaccharide biosynthesis predicted glycosyltransferase SpsG